MRSIARNDAEDRVALVVDTAVGAQGDSKGLKAHLRAIRKSVGAGDPSARSSAEFNRRFGGGI